MFNIRDIDFSSELNFATSKSSGKGGQNVNKLSTKVELQFDYMHSALLSDEQKSLIGTKLTTYINKDGILKIISQEDRSQWMNKNNTIEKFYGLLEKAFRKKKKRILTKRSKTSQLKRLKSKKINSDKKKTRAKPSF